MHLLTKFKFYNNLLSLSFIGTTKESTGMSEHFQQYPRVKQLNHIWINLFKKVFRISFEENIKNK